LFFTLGCTFVMSGFASLKGWRSQMSHMLQRERLPFSAGGLMCHWRYFHLLSGAKHRYHTGHLLT
jgi:hypothetical protein